MPQTERPLRSLAIFGLAALAAVLSTAWTRGLTVDPAVGSGIWSWRAFGGNLLLFFGIVLAVTWLATPRRHRLARAPARPDPIGAVPASDPADMSSDLLQALLATSPAGMGLSTFDGKARYVSQNWTDMMGYTLADLPDGNMIHIYDDPADREAYVALLKREGRARNHELRLRRKDGSLLWVILDGTVVNVGGETLIVAWVYDIDALKQRADQIRTVAEQEQRAILDASPMGIAFVADDRMLRCNQMLVTLFGYPDRGALEAVSLAALFSDRADLVRLARRSARRLGKGERYRGEWRLVNADGTTFWADLTAMRLAVPGGTSVTMWMVENVTERKERERRIADREALFGLLLESSPAGLALTTHDGQMRFATEMWKRSFGFDDESFRAIEAGQLYADPADRAAYLEVLQRDGQVIDREIRARHRDGHDFWSRVSSKLVRVGNETLIAAWMQDISWRKERDRLLEEAQTALRVAVDEHRAIFETSSVGIVFLKNRIVIRCNRRLEEIFGYPPGGLDGVPARVWYDSDEAYAEAGKGYATALAGLISVREQRLVRRDGSKFWARVSGRAIDPTDPARGFVSIYEDFTVQREAIEALRIANDEQNAIFKAATSGIALIKDRIIGSCNRQLEALFGYGPGEFRGKPTRLWYATDEEHAAIGREIRIDFGRGEAHRSERQVIRKDGTPFWCRFSGRLLDPAEPDRGAVWMVEDVTDEREAAAALLRAKELAEQATREKSMFLANMSHEIRTPMNAIIGLSHLALQTELTARQRDYVKKVHDAGTSLLGVVNDILDFSKVEAGKLEIESTGFTLDDVLNRMSSLMVQRVHDKGLELLFDVAPDVPQGLLGDPLRLGQVLINLVGNAIKFTERGQIEVRVRTLALVGDRVDLHFEVHDTGIGMSEDQSARLFRAFTQVDGSATRKYGGTGLGLTISKRLVELMGGRIGVQSVSGQGSTFAFNVQLGIDEHVAVRQRVLPKELNGMRVLVADDNAAAREILSEQLRVLSFDVSAVESGATALQALRDADRDGPFGALFLDWKMPGMDGVETARRMGTDPPLRHPPRVIMVTAFAHEEVRTEAEAAGIHAFLSKPVGRSALVDTLVGLFAPQHGTVAAQAMPLSATRPDLTGVRVLLVEDNDVNRQIGTELLEGVGARVTVAINGQQALDRLFDTGPGAWDVVLMDVQMPVMDGLEATRRILEDARFADLPIIAMTAHALLEERRRCIEAGMVDHVAKPIDPEALFRTVAHWLRIVPPEVVPEPAASDVPVPRINGLDSEAGLQRVAGDGKLYRELLRLFADRQGRTTEEVAAALARGDWSTAERLVHSARGAAGNLGFTALQTVAGPLEQAIRAGRQPGELLQTFGARLDEAIAGIAGAVSGAVAPERPPLDVPPPAELEHQAGRLARMLQDSDGEVLDFLVARADVVHAVFAGRGPGEFERAVQSFDFDQALDLLHHAASAQGLSLGVMR